MIYLLNLVPITINSSMSSIITFYRIIINVNLATKYTYFIIDILQKNIYIFVNKRNCFLPTIVDYSTWYKQLLLLADFLFIAEGS